jgi:hypothetical protein
MNYSEMLDFEINCWVQEVTGKRGDYCNSWADAGPIIENNHIGIEHDGDCWLCVCFSENGSFESEHDNPLRAAMIVFLMMQERPNA